MGSKTTSEAELATHFINHFAGFDVYPEVDSPGGGITDIIVKAGKVIIAVEVKTSFNTTVIFQAFRNFCFSNISYVAVPRPGKGSFYKNEPAESLCKELGIGVLYYDSVNEINPHMIRFLRKSYEDYKPTHILEQVKPAYRRAIKPVRLYEWQKRSEAGSKNNRMTLFKITVEEIHAAIIKSGGKISIAEVFNDKKYHYSSTRGARMGILDMISRGVITTFKQDGKFLVVNETTLQL